MAGEKHLSASDSAKERTKKRKTRKIVLSALIIIMITGAVTELIILKNMASVDRRFIRGVERGVTDGWDLCSGDLQIKEYGKIKDTSFIDIEYEAVREFRNKAYQDKNLKSLAKRYIEDLKKCRAAATAHDPGSDSEAFWEDFSKPYTDRLIVLRKLYDGDYSMGSSWDDHPELLNEVLLRAWLAEKIPSIIFERKDPDEAIGRFTAMMKNDSGYDLDYISIDVAIYDSKDKAVGTAEVFMENIREGSNTELTFYFNNKIVSSYRITGFDCEAMQEEQEEEDV